MLDDLYKKLESIEKSLSECFKEILNNEELSYYKSILWAFKINLLQYKQYEIGLNINNIDLELNINKKKLDILKTILYLISTLLLLTYWPIGILSFIYAISNSKNIKNNLSYMQNIFNNSRELFDKCDRIAKNCQTFIGKKMEVSAERFNEQVNNKDVIDLEPYYYAQNLIDLYISFGVLMETTPEIEEIVIKILQSDLETEESNFMTLLNLAKEKLSEEKILEKKAKSDELYQKYDESCQKLQKIYNKKRKSSR